MTDETFTGIGKGAINVAGQRETLANSSEIARLWAEDGGPGVIVRSDERH